MDNRVSQAPTAGAPSGHVLRLPQPDGRLEDFAVPEQADWRPTGRPSIERARVFYAAPHVVASDERTIDWDATLAFRDHLWRQGIGVAEAMDTAQRGMGLAWSDVRTLVAATAERADGRPLVAGVGTDQLDGPADLDRIADAYLEQLEMVQDTGAVAVVMASRHLAAAATSPEDYADVYGRIFAASRGPVILHWLGEKFDAQLRGYWGTTDIDAALAIVAELIADHADTIDGIKISLLEAQREVELRARLTDGVRMYTGDDYNFPELIAGDGERHSGALLGAFNPLASLAGVALDRFDAGDADGARTALEVGLPLSKRVFEAPTQFYKAGVTLLAWLGGHQDRFVMLDHVEDERSIEHYAEVFRLAAVAGVLPDLDLAVDRMRSLLAAARIDA